MRNSIHLFVVFIFFIACSKKSKLSNSVIGDWCWDERILTISEKSIIFNNNSSDSLRYELFSDSTVTFQVEVGDGWSGKIRYISKDKILFFDSLLQEQIELTRIQNPAGASSVQ